MKATVRSLGWEAWCDGCQDGSGCTTRQDAVAWKRSHDSRCTATKPFHP
jgi:hypothetical protein